MRVIGWIALIITSQLSGAEGLKPRSETERLAPERLRAVNEARNGFAKERKNEPVMPNGIYTDYRAVLNVRADDGGVAEALSAAHKAGVNIVVFTGNTPIKMELKDDVLILSGKTDAGGKLEITGAGPSFLTRALTFRSMASENIPRDCRGFQLYDRGKAAERLGDALKEKAKSQPEWAQLVEAFNSYPDEIYGAAGDSSELRVWDQMAAEHACCCVANNAAGYTKPVGGVAFDSYELNFRHVSTHVLVREFNEKEVRAALMNGRTYVSHDWLCDPTGFNFGGANILGTFFMGDTIPYYVGNVKLGVFTPLPAHIRILREGKVVHEADGSQTIYDTGEAGTYRAEAWLKVDGEMRPWIYSNPIYVQGRSLDALNVLKLPSKPMSPDVTITKDVPYVGGNKDDAQKHQLDIYQPKEKKNLPVLMFVHGGAWRSGDRWQYPHLGNLLATKGILTFIPSYRLAPEHKFPAQIEDVAAAFKWVVDHAAEYGGDPERIYVGGHSAGGHLAALLVYDPKYLQAQQLSPQKIKGAVCLSGVYDLVAIGDSQSSVFGTDPAVRRDASPLFHVKTAGPPMLISCCEHDYLSLPHQAKELFKAVTAAGTDAQFLYVPVENHISEMLNITEPGDLTAEAIVKFVK